MKQWRIVAIEAQMISGKSILGALPITTEAILYRKEFPAVDLNEAKRKAMGFIRRSEYADCFKRMRNWTKSNGQSFRRRSMTTWAYTLNLMPLDGA